MQIQSDPIASEHVLFWFEQLNQPPLPNLSTWWQCQTVLKEAFDNAVEYAHQDLPKETLITIEAIRFEDRIEIRIWDYGLPFDLQQKLGEMPELEDNEADHGRGLKIMQKLSDHLSYERINSNQNCLLIVKYY